MKSNGTRKQLEENRQQHERHSQLQSAGESLQQEQLRDLLHNPQVFELLTEPDLDGPQWLKDTVGQHLHRDQVLSIFEFEDLWRKSWQNKIWGEKITMEYPHPESRSSNDEVNEIQRRIHGTDKRPLQRDEERKIKAAMEQKTDREKRADDGEFVDLLLSQVVRSEERSSDDTSEGLLSFGGDS